MGNSTMRILGKIIGHSKKLELLLTGLLFIIIFLLVSISIAYRYFLHSSFMWGPQIVTLLFTWMSMLGISYVYKERGHIAIKFLVERVSLPTQKIIGVVVYLVTLICFLLIAYSSIKIFPVHARRIIVGLRIPRTYLSSSVIVWSILMIITTFYYLLLEIQEFINLKISAKGCE